MMSLRKSPKKDDANGNKSKSRQNSDHYKNSLPQRHDRSSIDPMLNVKLSIFIAIVSITTRFYSIDKPAHVCWDETHFGKMASWYLNRTFFFDVHPPLGKMLIAMSGHLTGYDGRFAFDKPGDQYENWSQYVGMRLFCATMGLVIPLFIYRSTLSMTRSNFSAFLASIMVSFDNGMITLTRYILLDPPLLFFISSSILGMAEISFRLGPGSHREAFSPRWWFWLIWIGVSLACAFSVKFVGLFIVVLVGMRTAYDLWIILGDTTKPISYSIKHLLARVACLILVPAALYLLFFKIHLNQLNHSGNGDGFYSSAFQSQLIGNTLHNSSSPAHLTYGAVVTIKNHRIGGAYLHSHWSLYPEGVGAKQQQITTYSHKDSNNKWLIKRAHIDQDQPEDDFVRNGDLLILEHITTRRNLHSHFEIAPLTKRHFQVTCYGENGVGDINDIWKIVKDSSGPTADSDDRIFTVRSRFRLVHYLTNCALHSHSKQLPKWGFEQMEVTCNPKLFDKNNYWNIEDNHSANLPNVSFENFKPSFMEQFIEAHAVMLQGNAGLKPKEGEVTSRPWQWPLNYRGQFFSASKDHKIYLLGNPLIWWSNILALPLSLNIMLTIAILNKVHKTKYVLMEDQSNISNIQNTFLEASTWTLLGWATHYIPFYFMGRILYFHHYFPAFLFSCMLTAMTIDYVVTLLCRKLRISNVTIEQRKFELAIVLTTLVTYTFTLFIPITYGTGTYLADVDQNSTIESLRTEQQLSSLKWLDSWEF